MAVTADNQHSGPRMIRHYLMTDTFSCIIEFVYSLLSYNISDFLILCCQFCISRRGIMVKYNKHLVGVCNILTSHFLKCLINARSIVMSKNNIRSGKYNSTSWSFEYLFSKCFWIHNYLIERYNDIMVQR